MPRFSAQLNVDMNVPSQAPFIADRERLVVSYARVDVDATGLALSIAGLPLGTYRHSQAGAPAGDGEQSFLRQHWLGVTIAAVGTAVAIVALSDDGDPDARSRTEQPEAEDCASGDTVIPPEGLEVGCGTGL